MPAYIENYWATPMTKDPTHDPADRQAGAASRRSSTRSSKTQGRHRTSTPRCNSSYEWKYFASSEGSYIEQEICHDHRRRFTVTARKDDVDADAELQRHRR